MIIAYIHQPKNATNMIHSAYSLSKSLKKQFAILYLVENETQINSTKDELNHFLEKENLTDINLLIRPERLSELTNICEGTEASFLFLQLPDKTPRLIQKQLNACRGLRIPYLLYKDSFPLLNPDKVMVPVTFLEEEYEKAQFASAFGRFCNSSIQILLANDYGSKAQTTAEKMIQLFEKFQLNYTLDKAKRDSFKVEKEAVLQAEHNHFGIVLLSASRDYGLDDIIFGPKEQHLIKKSSVPVLLINPRGDLYALCD